MPAPPRRLSALLIVVLAVLLGLPVYASPAASAAAAIESSAAAANEYGPPEWFPLRGSWMVGCSWNNGCSGGYHGTPAMDIARNPTGSVAGDPVYSAGRGLATVFTTGGSCGSGNGNSVQVDHGNGVKSYYFHLSSFAIGAPTWVDENSVLGYVGHTGDVQPCSFNHLHFDVRVNGVKVSPGQLKACVGNRLTSYPAELGATDWPQVPPWSSVRSDGTTCGARPPSDGDFVSYRGAVYRLAGGAPVFVDNWAIYGGQQPTLELTDTQWNALRWYPTDGAFLTALPSGEVFRVAGGAPVYISSWDIFGGSQPTVTVGDAAVRNAGAGGPYSHLNAFPADGTFLTAYPSQQVFRVAGAAPVYVSSWDIFGGGQPSVAVNDAAVRNAGGGHPWSHLRFSPADGTFLAAYPSQQVFRVAGGAPLYVDSWSTFGGGQPFVAVNDAVVQNAGGASPWNHLQFSPADGTLLATLPTGRVFQVRSGTPVYVADWAQVGGARPSVAVSDNVVTNAGAASSPWGHLKSAGGLFQSVAPFRVLDTRNGTGAPRARVGPSASVAVQVTGVGGVPSQGVSAVVVNLTVTTPDEDGWLTAYANGAPSASTSSVNFLAGQTLPNLAVVPVGADGRIRIVNHSGGTAQLIADVAGYYLTGAPAQPGAFGALPPTRALDTRDGTGAAAGAVAGEQSVAVQVTGVGGVPAGGVSAVVVNLTATLPGGAGWLTADADGAPPASTSNVNFGAAQTMSNLAVVPVGANGRIRIVNHSAAVVQVIADVSGYYLAGQPVLPGAFTALPPTRVLDTRDGTGAAAGAVAASGSVAMQVSGAGGVPDAGASATVVNLLVAEPTADGWLTAFANGRTPTSTSSLNFLAGQAVPNLAVLPVGTDGRVRIVNNSAGTVQLIADVYGYYLPF